MQLPRGTFREIRKYVTIERILADIEQAKFSGIANISDDTITGTLVFKAGKCILVKFLNKPGDSGWDELRRSSALEVDVALSSLDEAQIQLALEFNKSRRLVKTITALSSTPIQRQTGRGPEPQKLPVNRKIIVPQKPHPAPSPGLHIQRAPIPMQAPPVSEPRPGPAQSPPPYPAMNLRPPAPSPHAPLMQGSRPQDIKPPEEDALSGEAGSTSFDDDVDTFDSMDLDNVTDKIRTDCQTMIKQLHLEHLMER